MHTYQVVAGPLVDLLGVAGPLVDLLGVAPLVDRPVETMPLFP